MTNIITSRLNCQHAAVFHRLPIAFRSRFSSTCVNPSASATTGGQSSQRLYSTRIRFWSKSELAHREAIFDNLVKIVPLEIRGTSFAKREQLLNNTIEAVHLFNDDSDTQALVSGSDSLPSARSCAAPRMPPSGFLTSWATVVASLPSVANRSDWTSESIIS